MSTCSSERKRSTRQLEIEARKRIKSREEKPKIENKTKETNHCQPSDDVTNHNTFEENNVNCDGDQLTATKPLVAPKPDGFLEVDQDELDLERTLLGGQSFRWTKEAAKENHDNAGDGQTTLFTGIIHNQVLQLWRISSDKVAFRTLNKQSSPTSVQDKQSAKSTRATLEDYFQLRHNLKDLYRHWSSRDENLAKCCQQYTGFRILRQDPVENVFSFICATNNNIKRISQMVDKLCKRYGDTLEVNDEYKQTLDSPPTTTYHSFPPVERLAGDDVFQCLRYELGFGYRAKFITATAGQILKLAQQEESSSSKCKSPRDYLLSLRELPYKDTCKQLMQFQGIGRKVADCICLMSMDHLNSVPIDCHIYEIVCRHYMPNLRRERKTLTDFVHDLIGDHFVNLHGPMAGWSTSVLFVAELKHLKQNAVSEEGGEQKKRKTTKKSIKR